VSLRKFSERRTVGAPAAHESKGAFLRQLCFSLYVRTAKKWLGFHGRLKLPSEPPMRSIALLPPPWFSAALNADPIRYVQFLLLWHSAAVHMPASLYSGDYARVSPKSMALFSPALRAFLARQKANDLLAHPRA
jgi:hypothetical protein